jgi:hypothetical protein
MSPDTAATFRNMLELVGSVTLATALGVALLVQLHVMREVRSEGNDDEHGDFKIRTEERRQQQIEKLLEEQKIVIEKLKEAHVVRQKEAGDVQAMRHHDRHAPPDSTRNPVFQDDHDDIDTE